MRGVVGVIVTIVAAFGATRLLHLPPAVAVVNTITLSGPPGVGAGLQDVYRLALNRQAPAGGVEVLLQTQPTAACVLATREEGQGTASLMVTVPQGKRHTSFVVQSENVAAQSLSINGSDRLGA
ncbi:MAG: hypothetical protein ACE5I7_15045, partial [Candidatus Binatia bacterium]